jgi:hypothetical protein
MWNKQEYLLKMCEDTVFLLEYPNVSEWLGFSPTANPFLLPPEVLFEVCNYCVVSTDWPPQNISITDIRTLT